MPALSSLEATATGPVCPGACALRDRSHRSGSLCTMTQRSPHSLWLGKARTQQWRPSADKKTQKLVKKNVLLQPLSRWCTDDKPPHPTVTAEAWVLGHLDGCRFCGPPGWWFIPCHWSMPIFSCLVSGRPKEQWINTLITNLHFLRDSPGWN